ncbi:hypothetical protein D3C75_938500 [compost metagenome]
MQIHALFQDRAGKRIFIDAQQHRIREVQPVDILPFLQEHDQPEIVGIAFKMLILPPHILADRLLLHRACAGLPHRLRRLLHHKLLQNAVQHLFSLVAERRVAEVMRNGCTFHHLRINDQPRILRLSRFNLRVGAQQAFGRFTGNLRHFQRVGQTRPVVIAGACAEHLGFALQPAEGRRMDQTRIIAFICGSRGFQAGDLRILPVFSFFN